MTARPLIVGQSISQSVSRSFGRQIEIMGVLGMVFSFLKATEKDYFTLHTCERAIFARCEYHRVGLSIWVLH